MKMIGIEDFAKVNMRVGTIVEADINKRVRKPAYKLTIDFGEELGVKTSSARAAFSNPSAAMQVRIF